MTTKEEVSKADVIKDNRSGLIYWDTGIIRIFETVLDKDLTKKQAIEKYPDIIILAAKGKNK